MAATHITGGTYTGARATRFMTRNTSVRFGTLAIAADHTTSLVPPMRSAIRPMVDAGWAMNSFPRTGEPDGRVFAFAPQDQVDIDQTFDQVPRV
jgi:hypothetical protein